MRTLLSGLSTLLSALLVFVLIPLLVIGIAAAVLLGIGSLLTRWFAVTVFEASLIVTLAAVPLVLIYARLLNNLGWGSGEVEVEQDEELEPRRGFERMIVTPSRPLRGRKRRNQ